MIKVIRNTAYFFLLATLFSWGFNLQISRADEGHGHHDEPKAHHDEPESHHEEKKEMHHHAPTKKKTLKFPPGTKEVIIDLSGPFCSKHPEAIVAALKERAGIHHVEAFNSRNYILIRYNPDKIMPPGMAETVSALKGSGWRCKGVVSTRRRTER